MNMKEHSKYLREGYWSHTRLQKTTNGILNCVVVLPFLCPSWRRRTLLFTGVITNTSTKKKKKI